MDTVTTVGSLRNRLHRHPTDLASNVNVRNVTRNVVSQQIAMDQRDIANQRHGIEYREPRERVKFYFILYFVFRLYVLFCFILFYFVLHFFLYMLYFYICICI